MTELERTKSPEEVKAELLEECKDILKAEYILPALAEFQIKLSKESKNLSKEDVSEILLQLAALLQELATNNVDFIEYRILYWQAVIQLRIAATTVMFSQ